MRTAVLVLGFAAALVLGWLWYANVSGPGTRRAAPLLAPSDQPVAAAPAAARQEPAYTPPVAPQPTPFRLPRYYTSGPLRPDAPPQAAAPVPARTQPTPEPPSGMDQLREKAERWRALYAPVAQRIAELEPEVRRLEEEHRRTRRIKYLEGPRDPNLRTDAERTSMNLSSAQDELQRLRKELAQIEEDARRDGVPSGQLY